jgi:hypothetical protein
VYLAIAEVFAWSRGAGGRGCSAVPAGEEWCCAAGLNHRAEVVDRLRRECGEHLVHERRLQVDPPPIQMRDPPTGLRLGLTAVGSELVCGGGSSGAHRVVPQRIDQGGVVGELKNAWETKSFKRPGQFASCGEDRRPASRIEVTVSSRPQPT